MQNLKKSGWTIVRRFETKPEPADSIEKWFTCLGCGIKMWTDRCHRFCKKCKRRIGSSESIPQRLPPSLYKIPKEE